MLTTALLVLALAPQTDAAPPAPLLKVEGGYTEEIPLTPGATVHVWARMDSHTQVFLGWEGSAAAHLDAPTSWHAVLTVPAEGIAEPRLRARTATLVIEPRSLNFEGQTREKIVEYLAPAQTPAKALVFYCHDSTGRRGALLKSEAWNLALTLVHHGYAVAAISSQEAETMKPGEDGVLRWNGKEEVLAENQDMQNLLAARAALVAAGVVAEDADGFAFGQGNGGTFAASAAAVLGWRRAASFCGPGRKQLLEKLAAPTMWVVTTTNYHYPTAMESALENQQLLKNAGVAAEVHVVHPSPLRVERFLDRCGMDEEVAATTYATMQKTGVVDERGNVRLTAMMTSSRLETQKLAYADFQVWIAEDPSRMAEVFNQIQIVCAGHSVMADHAMRMLAFFEAQRDR